MLCELNIIMGSVAIYLLVSSVFFYYLTPSISVCPLYITSLNVCKMSHDREKSPYRKLKIDLPPTFNGDGSEDFGLWSRRFEVAVNASDEGDEYSQAQLLPTRLGGAAFSYWNSLSESVQADYDKVKDLMKEAFRKRDFLSTFQTYINARPRLPNEP